MNNKASRCVIVKRRGFLLEKKLVCFRRSNSACVARKKKKIGVFAKKPDHSLQTKKKREISHHIFSLFSFLSLFLLQ